MSYPIIDFKKKIGLRSVNGRGYLIGQYLIVAPAIGNEKKFQIYTLHNGKLLIPTTFTDKGDALETAKWLNSMYYDYFEIWDTHPEADIFALTKWTVRNGIQIYEFLQVLKHLNDVSSAVLDGAYTNAQERVKEWTRK